DLLEERARVVVPREDAGEPARLDHAHASRESGALRLDHRDLRFERGDGPGGRGKPVVLLSVRGDTDRDRDRGPSEPEDPHTTCLRRAGHRKASASWRVQGWQRVTFTLS